MKTKIEHRRALYASILACAMGLLSACGNESEMLAQEIAAKERATYQQAKSTPRVITVEVERPTPAKKVQAVETVATETIAGPVAPAIPGEVPVPPNPSDAFLAHAYEVDPWLANYSYGAMPTRFAKEGPFLYSVETEFDPNSFRVDTFSDDDGWN